MYICYRYYAKIIKKLLNVYKKDTHFYALFFSSRKCVEMHLFFLG